MALLLLAVVSSAQALPNTSTPVLNLVRTIQTEPFVGTTLSVKDSEGGAFVPNVAGHPNSDGTDSLWLADDNGDSAWELSPATGAYKHVLRPTDWAATPQYSPTTGTGSGPLPTAGSYADLESIAYDRASDTLYVFNGKCCTSSVRPAVFRLRRAVDGTFHPESWQLLPSGTDYTAAAWSPTDGKVYVGVGSTIRAYDYATNTSGPTFGVSGVSGIFGLGFSEDGADLLIVTSAERLFRVQWSTRTVVPGWSFDLRPFSIADSRAVELINDQFYVFDGYDGRKGSPLSHAVFVLGVCCDSQGLPTASFTNTQLSSPPLTVQFTDTSTGGPTAWSWSFGDGSTSTSQNPTHTYATSGTYTVTLTASNANGPGAPFSRSVTVSASPAPTASFTSTQVATPPLTLQFTDTSTGAPTAWSWDFGDGGSSTSQNPTHTYFAAGTYTVTLVASNANGSSAPASSSVTVSTGGTSLLVFSTTADTYAVQGTPTTSYGTESNVRVKKTASNDKRAFFKFAVSGVTGRTIASAKLRLYVTESSVDGGTVFSTASTWDETGSSALTWNTMPATTSGALSTLGAVTFGTFVEFDVTAAIAGDNVYSFLITSASSDAAFYASREGARVPELVVSFT